MKETETETCQTNITQSQTQKISSRINLKELEEPQI